MTYTPDAWIERNEDDPDDPYYDDAQPELEYAYDDLERTEATTDYFDHNSPTAEEQFAYWNSDAFLSGHNGEQPHE